MKTSMKKTSEVVRTGHFYVSEKHGLAAPSYIVREGDEVFEYIPDVGFNGSTFEVYYPSENKIKR